MPPQHPDEIVRLVDNLEKFINDNELSDLDPLVKWQLFTISLKVSIPFMMVMEGMGASLISFIWLNKTS